MVFWRTSGFVKAKFVGELASMNCSVKKVTFLRSERRHVGLVQELLCPAKGPCRSGRKLCAKSLGFPVEIARIDDAADQPKLTRLRASKRSPSSSNSAARFRLVSFATAILAPESGTPPIAQ